jgi:AAA15 family ATPase/GTPase
MIPSLHITGFKLFRDLELPKLGSLNLFVGKNNTGKTCLLEAVSSAIKSSHNQTNISAAQHDRRAVGQVARVPGK